MVNIVSMPAFAVTKKPPLGTEPVCVHAGMDAESRRPDLGTLCFQISPKVIASLGNGIHFLVSRVGFSFTPSEISE